MPVLPLQVQHLHSIVTEGIRSSTRPVVGSVAAARGMPRKDGVSSEVKFLLLLFVLDDVVVQLGHLGHQPVLGSGANDTRNNIRWPEEVDLNNFEQSCLID